MSRSKKAERDNYEGDRRGYPRDKYGNTTRPSGSAEQYLSDNDKKRKRKTYANYDG